jgi:hypothetical protein
LNLICQDTGGFFGGKIYVGEVDMVQDRFSIFNEWSKKISGHEQAGYFEKHFRKVCKVTSHRLKHC